LGEGPLFFGPGGFISASAALADFFRLVAELVEIPLVSGSCLQLAGTNSPPLFFEFLTPLPQSDHFRFLGAVVRSPPRHFPLRPFNF